MNPPEDEQALLKDWWERVRESQWAHYECAKHLTRTHYLLGVPLVILAGFAGTAVFATISHSEIFELRLAVGLTSVLLAVLGALQTFLRLADRASEHRLAAADYARARRLIEERITGVGHDGSERITKIREMLDGLTMTSPAIPTRIAARVDLTLKRRDDGG
jgi:hypothetical protein